MPSAGLERTPVTENGAHGSPDQVSDDEVPVPCLHVSTFFSSNPRSPRGAPSAFKLWIRPPVTSRALEEVLSLMCM
jgi:hypothetical protein